MWWRFGSYVVILVVMAAVVVAAETVPTVSDANKFLSAEAARHIDEKSEEMLQEMKKYQDENFAIWDGRMYELVDDMKMKFIIGGLGVVLLGMGLTAYLMARYFRRYSYEEFLEGQLKTAQESVVNERDEGVDQMQQTDWYPQQPQQTIGMEFGQQWASDSTQMNQWQAQPAYDGSWRAPVETVKESIEDPMQSPGDVMGGYR